MMLKSSILALALLAANGVDSQDVTFAPPAGDETKSKKVKKARKGSKTSKSARISPKDSNYIGFDSKQWLDFDGMAKSFDADYLGDYESIDTTELSEAFTQKGFVSFFDLGSFGSLVRRRGIVISLAEIRTIWYELSPIVGDNNGIVLKSVGDSLQLYFENVSDGLTATRAMYLAVIARWREKVARACGNTDVQVFEPPEWCGNDERDPFFNTAAVGGGYGDVILIPDAITPVDAYGAPVNNAYFAGEEEAEHGETMIDEGALVSLLLEANINFVPNEAVEWTAGDFGIDHFIIRDYTSFKYYTVCFDVECKIPDDE